MNCSCRGPERMHSLKLSFDLIIVDEAAQSMELSTLIPLRFNCSKMILVGLFTYLCVRGSYAFLYELYVPKSDSSFNSFTRAGDPQQLPATIISQKAKFGGLGRSLFERLVKCGHKVSLASPWRTFSCTNLRIIMDSTLLISLCMPTHPIYSANLPQIMAL